MAVQAQHTLNNPLSTDPRNRTSQFPGFDFSGIDAHAFLAQIPFGVDDDSQPMVPGSTAAAQRSFYQGNVAPVVGPMIPNFALLQQPAMNNPPPAPAIPSRKRRKEASNRTSQPRQQAPVALQLVDLNQTQGAPAINMPAAVVSTGLRLAFDDEHSTVTSSRPEIRAVSGHSLQEELSAEFSQQQEELNQFLKNQTEQLRQALEERTHRHSQTMLAMIDEQASRQLRDKELEIERANRRNMELEERIRQLSLETHMWQNKAKSNEAMVAVLRTNLQQAVVQSRDQSKAEGCGESEVDDAASAYIDENAGAQQTRSMMMVMKAGQDKVPSRVCKKCRAKEVSVLLLPCLHLCLCNDCRGEVEKCLICNCISTACVEVYLS